MKRVLLTLSVIFCFLWTNGQQHVKKQIALGDPFIFLYENNYYMYGTHNENGIEVYHSTDLLNWEKKGLALNKNDVWGDKWFWAPEVYYIKGIFFMYFSANERMVIATSDSPLGPFIQEVKEPVLPSKAIDHHLFIDDDGKPYLYFVNFTKAGLSTWVAEMNDDLLSIKKETMKECIRAEQEWEKVYERVNEGPYVLKKKDKYYLFYSGNAYFSQNYGVGVAVADNPLGPWNKYKENPIFQFPDSLKGVGHGAFFKDLKGKQYYVYHAHYSDKSVHPRLVYFNEFEFKKKRGYDFLIPAMKNKIYTPVLKN